MLSCPELPPPGGSSPRAPPFPLLQIAPSEPCDAADDGDRDDVVGVAERVVEVLPVRSCDVACAGEGEAPDRRAQERENGVANERHFEDTRGDGHERPDDGSEAAQEDGP